MKRIIVLLVILSVCFAQKPVNYANTLIKWGLFISIYMSTLINQFTERRELECEASINGQYPGPCKLYKGNSTESHGVRCVFDKGNILIL